TFIGGWVAHSSIGPWFNLSTQGVTWAMAIYGFVAAVLPVWVLLAPRDYLSSFLKIGTIALLVIGTIVANPKLEAPAINHTFLGGGPVVAGKIFPFLFIVLMCGAISGFHALVSSGTTPKMIEKESQARAVGMSQIFGRAGQRISASGEQAMQSLWKYWYHFAIMFEALFILTTIDAGTRIGRFLIQEIAGKVHPQLGRTDWWPGAIASTVLIVFAWAWFMNSDSFDTIWTMFGIANQMLAVIALTVVSVCLVNEGKGRYVWVTVVPLAVV